MPAKAGIQSFFPDGFWIPVYTVACFLDSRFRGNDILGVRRSYFFLNRIDNFFEIFNR